MKTFKIDWTTDKFEDYASEDEWINAYPDNPCPNCGKPEIGDDCTSCDLNWKTTCGNISHQNQG